MNYILIPLFYLAVLWFDWLGTRGHISKRERVLYAVLAFLAFASAFPAAYWEHLDHAGASLSGMLSLFLS